MKQRTMLINQLRGLMAEFGIVVGARPAAVGELLAVLGDHADAAHPEPLREALLANGGGAARPRAARSRGSSGRSWTGAAATRPAAI